MSNLWIREFFVNATKGYRYGDGEMVEAHTDNVGKLFLSLQREYGRCISRLYIDTKQGETKRIGWVFQKKARYDRSNETYLQETWVEVHAQPPTRSVEYHYLEI